MKILRTYKGFTTNSSSAAEWVPPPDLKEKTAPASAPQPSGNAPGNTGESAAPAADTNTTPPANSATVEKESTPPPRRPSHLTENAAVLAGLVLAVLGVFVLERLIRRLLKKRRRG